MYEKVCTPMRGEMRLETPEIRPLRREGLFGFRGFLVLVPVLVLWHKKSQSEKSAPDYLSLRHHFSCPQLVDANKILASFHAVCFHTKRGR